ncbi:MAG: DUF2254 family protein [Caryophanon sp.]|nr:DUF2254 family protein [Caryophanon sp.]
MWKKFSILIFNNKTWVITLQYMLISCIILGIVILIDTGTLQAAQYIPSIFLTKVGLATTILSALAGALLSMTVFTFSTIMTIVNFYSSNYTASTIDDFVKSDIVLKVLGIFIGGFFYAVTALLFMRETYEHDYVIAGSVGVVYALVCVGFFVRFVQQILYGVQSTNLIKDIFEEAIELIRVEVQARQQFADATPQVAALEVPLRAHATGYVSAIHYEELSKTIRPFDGVIKIHTRMGQFTVEDAIIATLYIESEQDALDVSSYFVIQDAKIPAIDYKYHTAQLIDITLKSLPPGKADLNNAIHCIRKLSVLMAELLQAEGQFLSAGKDTDNLIYTVASTEEELYYAYNQIIPAAENEISVMLALFDGFYTMKRIASPDNAEAVEQFATHVYERVAPNFPDTLDKKYLQRTFEKMTVS